MFIRHLSLTHLSHVKFHGKDLVLAQSPNLPFSSTTSSSYIPVCITSIACSTQWRRDMLGVLPWHPCSMSDTSRLTPMPDVRKCITHPRTGHCTSHMHRRSPEPYARRPQHSHAVSYVHSAAAPETSAHRIRLLHRTIDTVYMRAAGYTSHLPKQSMQTAVDVASALPFPLHVRPCQCALGAAPGRLCVYPVVE
jgi:hypothetical protein